MRVSLTMGVLLAIGLLAYLAVDAGGLAQWAAQKQRAVQNTMAAAIRALQGGEAGALATLFAAAAAYGFFHAVGPGHGKALIGGVGLGSRVTAVRLLTISVVSSLAQAFWAIILVYGGFALFEMSARRMTDLAEKILAPVSYLAIALIGLLLVWRGTRDWVRAQRIEAGHHSHDHDHPHGEECGCHSHGPSVDEVAHLTSWRDTLALVASIAVRPCTGAIFLLVIAWQMDLRLAGAGAAIVMGLGTASFTSVVAVSSVAARTMALVSADRLNVVAQILPGVQILAGAAVVWISLSLLGYSF